MQILGLTNCSHAELVVDIHPNLYAQNNELVGRIPEHRQRRVEHQRYKMSCERRPKTLQILELTPCSHVGLFVDSHPKFTCQKHSISGSHASRT